MGIRKHIYFFKTGKADGKADMKNLLGGKGANLAEMCNLKIPVPAGFTITTKACVYYFKHKNTYPTGLKKEIDANLKRLEREMGKEFGSNNNPLLLSVRSGSRASMPGMMDTVLNLGLNDSTLAPLIKLTGNERFVYDSYRRFIQMFSNVVLDLEGSNFEAVLKKKKMAVGAKLDTDLNANALKELCADYKALVKEKTKKSFPQDPRQQLALSINAVFDSWNNYRAVEYRKMYKIPADWG
ncbi:MAG: PEP/pyruvate-binding domain-containing protein, partial [Nitrospinota bacterium]